MGYAVTGVLKLPDQRGPAAQVTATQVGKMTGSRRGTELRQRERQVQRPGGSHSTDSSLAFAAMLSRSALCFREESPDSDVTGAGVQIRLSGCCAELQGGSHKLSSFVFSRASSWANRAGRSLLRALPAQQELKTLSPRAGPVHPRVPRPSLRAGVGPSTVALSYSLSPAYSRAVSH